MQMNVHLSFIPSMHVKLVLRERECVCQIRAVLPVLLQLLLRLLFLRERLGVAMSG